MSFYATFQNSNGDQRLGVVLREKKLVIDLGEAQKSLHSQGVLKADQPLPATMQELIEAGPAVKSVVESIVNQVKDQEQAPYIHREEDIKYLAPIPRPKKNVFAVGLNYKKHSQEFLGSDDLAQCPIIFSKAPTSVIGTEAGVERFAEFTDSLDYEAELAVVIGKRGRNIAPEDVQDYIFGYSIINDISARDRQKRTSQWFLGKTMDTHCPMGPYLADASEVEWPVELEIMCRVNGEERQHSNTRLLLFDIPAIISTLSQGTTLEPGDIIATGTCEGVGLGFNPPKFLNVGDVVEVEIEKLGTLRNPIV
jgi:2-keto-4-pentenoate hydratase/2-oxohepta-3-ene-1,7-dioic acid hydratase in catechol pathway